MMPRTASTFVLCLALAVVARAVPPPEPLERSLAGRATNVGRIAVKEIPGHQPPEEPR
jgi:hypothetical protein